MQHPERDESERRRALGDADQQVDVGVMLSLLCFSVRGLAAGQGSVATTAHAVGNNLLSAVDAPSAT